jgi:hypothetical protein
VQREHRHAEKTHAVIAAQRARIVNEYLDQIKP